MRKNKIPGPFSRIADALGRFATLGERFYERSLAEEERQRKRDEQPQEDFFPYRYMEGPSTDVLRGVIDVITPAFSGYTSYPQDYLPMDVNDATPPNLVDNIIIDTYERKNRRDVEEIEVAGPEGRCLSRYYLGPGDLPLRWNPSDFPPMSIFRLRVRENASVAFKLRTFSKE